MKDGEDDEEEELSKQMKNEDTKKKDKNKELNDEVEDKDDSKSEEMPGEKAEWQRQEWHVHEPLELHLAKPTAISYVKCSEFNNESCQANN